MDVEIPLHPEDETGVEILDKFEAFYEMKPMPPGVLDDGTRRYGLSAEDHSAALEDIEAKLDKIDLSWRDHVTLPRDDS